MSASISSPFRPFLPSLTKSGARSALGSVWGLSLWLATVGNLPLWQRLMAMDHSLGQRWVLVGVLGFMTMGGTVALLSVVHWPRVYRLLASVLVLMAAFNSYFMWQYGVVIDSTMLTSAIHTDANEVRDLMSWQLLFCIGLIAGPALWWIWRDPVGWLTALKQLGLNIVGALVGLALVVAAALAGYQELASLMRNHKDLRFMINPLNSVYGLSLLVAENMPHTVRDLRPVGEDARLGASYTGQTRPPLVVLVVGETARAQNWQLNGYPRFTTPKLRQWQLQGGLVNFSNVRSCGTNTQVSVPCMFSPLSRVEGGDRAPEEENLLDVLQRAGLAVLWLENQSGCKGVCDRVPHAETRRLHLPRFCADGECADAVMLQNLDARIAALDPARRAKGVVLVMHQMGSHGPAYAKRRPKEVTPFLPECNSATLSDCEPEQLVNAYDNTIARTDDFLHHVLRWSYFHELEGRYDTGVMYVSDHGESLGENGLYLHGLPFALAPSQQTHVPMIGWLSPGMQARVGVSDACMRGQADAPLSHDNLFHTVLGLMDVETQAYKPALDAFKTCRL
jgi:lipid A ethanolaminephosphotransferase